MTNLTYNDLEDIAYKKENQEWVGYRVSIGKNYPRDIALLDAANKLHFTNRLLEEFCIRKDGRVFDDASYKINPRHPNLFKEYYELALRCLDVFKQDFLKEIF